MLEESREVLQWVEEVKNRTRVCVREIPINESNDWDFDLQNGNIHNKKNTFFEITGLRETNHNGELVSEQPIIIQKEIGILGFMAKVVDEELYLLLQAKIEPGNINYVQLSPTVQATESNYLRKHGGRSPEYLDFFIEASIDSTIVDVLQSEQSSRFLGKRNRNIVVKVDKEIPALSNFRWVSLSAINELLEVDNLINMDSRTVLSCLPKKEKTRLGDENILVKRIEKEFLKNENSVSTIRLDRLDSWSFENGEFVCKYDSPFKVVFAEIEIEGREVTRWTQPMCKSLGPALFVLALRDREGKKEVLLQLKKEIGCLKGAEFGPSIQREYTEKDSLNNTEKCLMNIMTERPECVKYDHYLSEEGGRFFHEQNRNILINTTGFEITLVNEYIWVDLATVNEAIKYSNVLNIQLRTLLSLLEVSRCDLEL